LGAGYARDRGLGFSLEAAPSWDADALCISDGQGWAKAQPGHTRNRTKRETRWGQDYLRVLDIMAKESYLLQGTIYSNSQTIVNYYNGTRIGQ